MLTVQKFGGSSLADADKMRRAAEICIAARQSGQKTVLVVSAMGDTTDALRDRAYSLNENSPHRENAALMTTGEQQSAALMAIILDGMGVPALSLTGWQSGIFTDSVFDDALPEVTFPSRIEEALEKDIVPVVTGYQGVDISGNITTLGRGGSDTTAVLLAAALNADKCEIYTDVEGIYTADPRLVKSAKRVETIDFRDMLELAQAGSQVLHHKSVRLAMANGVNIRLLSTVPGSKGSLVCLLKDEDRPEFAGITVNRESSRITIAGKGCRAELLPMAALELSDSGIRASGGGVGRNSIYLTVEKEQLMLALGVLHDLFF